MTMIEIESKEIKLMHSRIRVIDDFGDAEAIHATNWLFAPVAITGNILGLHLNKMTKVSHYGTVKFAEV